MNKVFPWLFILLGIYGIYLAWPTWQFEQSSGLANGSMFPHLVLEKSDGKRMPVPATNDKIKVINVWATWCEPCRVELPMLQSMASHWRDKGVEFILTNEQLDSRQAVIDYLKSAHIELPLYFLRQEDSQRLGGIRFVPMTFVVDRRGRLVTQHEGLVDGTALAAELERLTVE